MKKPVAVVLFSLAVIMLLGGCPSEPGGQTPPGSKAPTTGSKAPAEVKAVGANDQSLLDALNGIDNELTRIEQEKGEVSREPGLNRDRVFEFKLEGVPSLGKDDAKLVMVVFSDFECPFCKKFASTAEALVKKYPDSLRLVFMNFPLHNECNDAVSRAYHKNACMAAEAAMAAAEQGKFWEMHDYIFENQRTIKEDDIVAFAKSRGMNAEAIKQAMDTRKYEPLLREQARQLIPTGSRGTPSVFVNGMKAENIRWDDINMASSFIESVLNPPEPETGPEKVAPAVQNPGSLPPARVVLDDGTRLEDRLQNIQNRLSEISLKGPEQAPKRPQGPDPGKVYSFNIAQSPSLGPAGAPVTLVVFSDFLCPHCYRLSQELKQLHEEFPEQVRIVFKNLPSRMHKLSLESHEAALAAGAQGKFWDMHDKIFENRAKITPERLRELAQEIGLDMNAYDEAVKTHPQRQILVADMADATNAAITGTPTVFINGRYVPNNRRDAIEAIIKSIVTEGK